MWLLRLNYYFNVGATLLCFNGDRIAKIANDGSAAAMWLTHIDRRGWSG